MSADESTRIVQAAYERFRSGQLEDLLQFFSDDIEWQLQEIEGVPFARKRQGRSAVREFFIAVADSRELFIFEPEDFVAQGDKVVALGYFKWLIKATGRPFESDFAHVFTVRDGKITGFREFTDTAAEVAAYRTA